MYIQKEIMTHYGIPVTHHTLQAIHTYYNDGISHINIAGYLSKDACSNGSSAFVINQIEVAKTTFENEKAIYNAVLESNVFKDGILCED